MYGSGNEGTRTLPKAARALDAHEYKEMLERARGFAQQYPIKRAQSKSNNPPCSKLPSPILRESKHMMLASD